MTVTNLTNEPFESLDSFLKVFDTEVRAHAREELSESEKLQLQHLAAGKLDEGARRRLIPLLARNEEAMEYLVSEAR